MNNQPFIISMDENQLPNMATDSDENYTFTFDKVNQWNEWDGIIRQLISINEKLEKIILHITENGRE